MGCSLGAQPAVLGKVIFAAFKGGQCEEVISRCKDGGLHSPAVGVESRAKWRTGMMRTASLRLAHG